MLVKDANATPSKYAQANKGGEGGNKGGKKDKKKPLEEVDNLPKGAPVVLIVSASGIRAVEVIRALPLFAEAAKIGKLFAKHLKVAEQVYFLENTCTHICVGTPNRIDKLISDGKFLRFFFVLRLCPSLLGFNAKVIHMCDVINLLLIFIWCMM